ncbi:hypothetical protein M9Y10_030296 [Tritrichomonas musculus]|uniref:mannose-6-phosphate isomerase n=1 Tax=Tritrichomonas musculus TaxID=1915356 RepID=A0ABR2KPK4_9EUKA
MSLGKALIPLQCKAMNYAWGKVGKNSLVYQYIEHSKKGTLDVNKPYAEFWMGDHPSAPSLTADGGKRLSEVIKVGEKKLPYLFKILSIQKPLSLQCHPNLSQAVMLHQKDPEHYPDPNHKPECGFFLTKGTLVYGIREYNEIIEFLKHIPEFKNLISNQNYEKFVSIPNEETFKNVLENLLTCDKKALAENLNNFKTNYQNGKYSSAIDQKTRHGVDLIIENFPDDVGIFIPFILNVIVSEPGKALFIPPGTLHAYLEGDLIEIMALSDNVVRAAMTPKFVDVETLFKVMNFKPLGCHYLEPKKEIDENNHRTFLHYYQSGFDSFNLEHGHIESHKSINIKQKKNASIIAILKGNIVKLNGEQYHEGNTVLIQGNTDVKCENCGNDEADVYICSSL